MPKRKIRSGEDNDALTCPPAKDNTVSKKSLTSAPLSREPRLYGLVYSRRKRTNKSTISTSANNIKQDEELSNLKLDCQSNDLSELHKENLGKGVCGSERSRTSSLPAKVVYTNPAKMLCGLCEKKLKRKPFVLENSVTLDDLSVVAVLVCGHLFHADCLEPRTSVEDQADPFCPLCVEKHYP